MYFSIENYFELRGSIIGGGSVVGRRALVRGRIVIGVRGIIFVEETLGFDLESFDSLLQEMTNEINSK